MEAICKDKDESKMLALRPSSSVLHPLIDLLAGLVNQSIVFRQAGDSVPRFGMLETIREYAQEKLAASGEEAVIRQRHALYYLSLVEAWTQTDIDPSLSVEPLEREYHNLRIALQWAIEQSQSELAMDLAIALWHYWTTRGSPNEGQYWLARVLAVKPPLHNPKRIYLLTVMGQITLYYHNDFQQAYAYYDEIAALAQELDSRFDWGVALQGLGDIAQFSGNYPRARTLYLESLALYREIENTVGIGWTLDRLGNVALEQGLVQEALAFYTECLGVFESLASVTGIAHAHAKLGLIALEKRRYADAAQLLESGLADLRPTGSTWVYAWLLEYLGQAVLGLGDLPRAADLFRESLNIHFEAGLIRWLHIACTGWRMLPWRRGRGSVLFVC
jgi:tetratricopeptide (TPR) repeat protein